MIEYTVIKSKRKSISVEVSPDCQIIVRAPRWMNSNDIRDFVVSKTSWIERHLKSAQELRDKMENDEAYRPFTDGELRALTEEAKKEFTDLVRKWTPVVFMGSPSWEIPHIKKINIRHQKTRWGSCSKKGNLNFNCLLMLAPEEVRDYVVIHELCHLKYMDHSPAFWREVAKAMPEYKGPYNWLKKNGNDLIMRLPY